MRTALQTQACKYGVPSTQLEVNTCRHDIIRETALIFGTSLSIAVLWKSHTNARLGPRACNKGLKLSVLFVSCYCLKVFSLRVRRSYTCVGELVCQVKPHKHSNHCPSLFKKVFLCESMHIDEFAGSCKFQPIMAMKLMCFYSRLS